MQSALLIYYCWYVFLVQFPKNWLKSRNFQEQCVVSVLELLSAHFSQWSYHISFPDLVTIPLVRLRKFHEITTIESFKRIVKRFIDQVQPHRRFSLLLASVSLKTNLFSRYRDARRHRSLFLASS